MKLIGTFLFSLTSREEINFVNSIRGLNGYRFEDELLKPNLTTRLVARLFGFVYLFDLTRFNGRALFP